MNKQCKKLAIFPGSFDPITLGHLDIIKRGVEIFDELIVAVGHNPDKKPLLELNERLDIIRQTVADIPNVSVESFEGLTVDFARKVNASAILRGIRNSNDLQFEFQTALTNRVVSGVETLFIMTSPQYAFTSSSLIRQIATMGGDISSLVPPEVLGHIKAAAAQRKKVDNNMMESE